MVENPFILRPYLSIDLFCDREKELAELLSYIENGRNITLISPRRLGKTGLIFRAFEELRTNYDNYDTYYVDISSTSSLDSFIKLLAESIAGNLKKSPLKRFLSLLGGIRPLISYNTITGAPEIIFTFRSEDEKRTTLKILLEYLENGARKAVLAIDEFQQIREYDGFNMEATLRTYIQNMHNVCFIFCGSKKHVMIDMFSNAKKPFYESTTSLPLGKLDPGIYAAFIKKQFANRNKQIDDDIVRFIINWTKDHTFYTQSLCNEVFRIGKGIITMQTTLDAIQNLLVSNLDRFLEIKRLVSDGQWKLLHAIACEGKVSQPTSASFIRKYGLTSGSSVLKTLNSLIDKELVLADTNLAGTSYSVYNVFLSRYLEILQ